MSTNLLSVPQAAERLQVSQPTVRRLIADGDLPSVQIKRRRFVLEDDLDAFVLAQRERTLAAAEIRATAAENGWTERVRLEAEQAPPLPGSARAIIAAANDAGPGGDSR